MATAERQRIITIDIQKFSRGLYQGKDEIWYTSNFTDISYPEEGYNRSFKNEVQSYWYQHRNDCIISAVRLAPPSGPIFDVGGGNGHVSIALLENGYDVVLVEPG